MIQKGQQDHHYKKLLLSFALYISTAHEGL